MASVVSLQSKDVSIGWKVIVIGDCIFISRLRPHEHMLLEVQIVVAGWCLSLSAVEVIQSSFVSDLIVYPTVITKSLSHHDISSSYKCWITSA
jgi:hypothetical protein